MLPQILPKENVGKFVKFLTQHYRVVGPIEKEKGFFDYAEIESPDQLRLDYNITVNSPKRFFFPPVETLLSYDKEKGTFKAEVEVKRTVILGAHPCDIRATWILDDVFSKDPKDPYYLSRRQRAIMIGLNCIEPCDDKCFCADMGSINTDSGYDLMLTDLGDRFYVEVATDAGQNLIDQSDAFTQATSEDHSAHQNKLEEKQNNFKHKIPYDTKYLPELLEQSYDSLIWEANARMCLSCGQCNLICPTCYCFDINDEDDITLKSGKRIRTWDGCQLRGFAEVAGGENFRPTAGERLRHRLMRKGHYLMKLFGKLGCVGCGRCDRNCPAGISVLRTYQQIAATTDVKV